MLLLSSVQWSEVQCSAVQCSVVHPVCGSVVDGLDARGAAHTYRVVYSVWFYMLYTDCWPWPCRDEATRIRGETKTNRNRQALPSSPCLKNGRHARPSVIAPLAATHKYPACGACYAHAAVPGAAS